MRQRGQAPPVEHDLVARHEQLYRPGHHGRDAVAAACRDYRGPVSQRVHSPGLSGHHGIDFRSCRLRQHGAFHRQFRGCPVHVGNRKDYEGWQTAGAKSLDQVCKNRWTKQLEEYVAPAMGEAVEAELNAFIERRCNELPELYTR